MLKPGRYQVEFFQAGPRYSDQWVIWDYLEMQANDKLVWKIGDDEVGRQPPDYSEAAFDEFASADAPFATNRYIVGKSEASHFVRELNDNDRRTCFVEFDVSNELSQQQLTLLISTLYSTHTGAREFRMQVKVQKLEAE
jgi:hypothetical protein